MIAPSLFPPTPPQERMRPKTTLNQDTLPKLRALGHDDIAADVEIAVRTLTQELEHQRALFLVTDQNFNNQISKATTTLRRTWIIATLAQVFLVVGFALMWYLRTK